MKINKNKIKNKKSLLAIIAIIAAILLAGSTLFYITTNSRQKSGSQSESNTTQNNPDDSAEGSLETGAKNNDNKTTTPPNTDQPAQQPTDPSTGKTKLQMVAFHDIQDDFVYIRGGINSKVQDGGTCVATLTGPNGAVIKKETPLLQGASTTDCKTVTISIADFAVGEWKYKLAYASDAAAGESGEGRFEIQ